MCRNDYGEPPSSYEMPSGMDLLGRVLEVIAKPQVRMNDVGQAWATGADVASTSTGDLLDEMVFLRWFNGACRFLSLVIGGRPIRKPDALKWRLGVIEAELERRGAISLLDLHSPTIRSTSNKAKAQPQPMSKKEVRPNAGGVAL